MNGDFYSWSELYSQAHSVATQAIFADGEGRTNEAIVLYKEAVRLLTDAESSIFGDVQLKTTLHQKATEYASRQRQLETSPSPGNMLELMSASEQVGETAFVQNTGLQPKLTKGMSLTDLFDGDESREDATAEETSSHGTRNMHQRIASSSVLEEARLLWEQAKTLEASGASDSNCVELYAEAAEKFINAMKTMDSIQKSFVHLHVESLLDKIETLKKEAKRTQDVNVALAPKWDSVQSSCQKYTDAELDVLRRSSTVNGRIFLPWLDTDVEENFITSKPFVDPDPLLPLSCKQERKLYGWVRPFQFVKGAPRMISQISALHITQDLVTDCSFVASLCITAAYEQRFKKQLITKIIFPQNRRGEPIYNPSGKYAVKLWVNGIPRKVVIDDQFPLGKNGKLLCSYSTNSSELWVSVIEKAYMKVHGGYDFPGSNSGIDLYSLTGWIPESIHFDPSSTNLSDYERTWQRLLSASHFGDCLITISTGDLSPEEAEQLGLVESHAYAVLDVKEICGIRLLQVKNPWSRVSWKGPFSADDNVNWTADLKQAVNFDQISAQQRDNGIFWIDFSSVKNYFRGLFMNWNPELFKFRTTLHKHWPITVGPRNDSYNLGYNPQYSLRVSVPRKSAQSTSSKTVSSVWILLSRHVVSKDQVAEQDFLTLHVYNEPNGHRVYYPQGALLRGTYSNNPHVLMTLDASVGVHSYTLVVSQYEKLHPIDYTLSVYSTAPFSLQQTPDPPQYQTKISSEWTEETSGGNPQHHTFLRNPQWAITISATCHVMIFLEAPVKYPANARLLNNNGVRVASVSQSKEIASSGDYRPGFCYLDIPSVDPGVYTVVPSTYEPGCRGNFLLTIASNSQHDVREIPPEGFGMEKQSIVSEWSLAEGTAAGCSNYGNYTNNPRWLLQVISRTAIAIRLRWLGSHPTPALNISVFASDNVGSVHTSCSPNSAFKHCTSNEGVYYSTVAGVLTPTVTFDSGCYCIIPSTFKPIEGSYEMTLYCSLPVSCELLDR